jgi:hypothetical protein
MGLLIEFVVSAIGEFFGWLCYDLWKERSKKRSARARKKHAQSETD